MTFADALSAHHDNHSVVREINVDGHTVAWVRYQYEFEDRPPAVGFTVMCDCDVTPVSEDFRGGRASHDGGHTWFADSRDCCYRAAGKLLVTLETREQIQSEFSDAGRARRLRGNMTDAFEPDVFDEMVLTLMRWALDERRWIGQDESAVLYYQSIGAVLAASDRSMDQACRRLYSQQKIGLTGAIVSWWTPADAPQDDDDSGLDDSVPPPGERLTGHLLFFSETGTEGGLWAFQADGFEGYDGLRILKTGDYLTAGDFAGYVRLRRYNLFTEDARGMWIHADQRGVERDTWAGMFFDGIPATLITRGDNDG